MKLEKLTNDEIWELLREYKSHEHRAFLDSRMSEYWQYREQIREIEDEISARDSSKIASKAI